MPLKILTQSPIKRVGWMVVIWTLSVAALGIFALAFRFLMSMAGLTE